MREYRAFSEAETWKDVEEELQAEAAPYPYPYPPTPTPTPTPNPHLLQAEGCRPVSADAASLSAVLDATQQVP